MEFRKILNRTEIDSVGSVRFGSKPNPSHHWSPPLLVRIGQFFIIIQLTKMSYSLETRIKIVVLVAKFESPIMVICEL